MDRNCKSCNEFPCICAAGPKKLWYVPYRDMDISINRPPNVSFCGTGIRVYEEGYHIEGCGIDNIAYREVLGPFKTRRGAAYAAGCCYGAQDSVDAYETVARSLWELSQTCHAINRSSKPKRNHNPKPTVSQKSLLAVYRAAARVFSVGSTRNNMGELGRRLTELEEAVNEAEIK